MTQDSDWSINFSASLQMLEFPKNSLPRSKTNQPESGRNYRVLNGLTLDKAFDKSKTCMRIEHQAAFGTQTLDIRQKILRASRNVKSIFQHTVLMRACGLHHAPHLYLEGLSNGTNKMAYRVLRDFAARKALREIDPKRRRLAGSPYLGRQN